MSRLIIWLVDLQGNYIHQYLTLISFLIKVRLSGNRDDALCIVFLDENFFSAMEGLVNKGDQAESFPTTHNFAVILDNRTEKSFTVAKFNAILSFGRLSLILRSSLSKGDHK